jgi:hypothetical protein
MNFKAAILAGMFIILASTGMKCDRDDKVSDHITIDPSMLVRCPALAEIDTTTMTMGELLQDNVDVRKLYTDCAIRNDCLIETVGGKMYAYCPADKKRVPVEEEKPKAKVKND